MHLLLSPLSAFESEPVIQATTDLTARSSKETERTVPSRKQQQELSTQQPASRSGSRQCHKQAKQPPPISVPLIVFPLNRTQKPYAQASHTASATAHPVRFNQSFTSAICFRPAIGPPRILCDAIPAGGSDFGQHMSRSKRILFSAVNGRHS